MTPTTPCSVTEWFRNCYNATKQMNTVKASPSMFKFNIDDEGFILRQNKIAKVKVKGRRIHEHKHRQQDTPRDNNQNWKITTTVTYWVELVPRPSNMRNHYDNDYEFEMAGALLFSTKEDLIKSLE